MIRRREFITLLGGAAAAWPVAARAQQDGRVRRVGVLMGYDERDPEAKRWVTAFERRLGELGWKKGTDLLIDYRWPGGPPDRLRAHAAELVSLNPEALLASNSPTLAFLGTATRTIPIVFANVSGVLARQDGNKTGVLPVEPQITEKWVSILQELVPDMGRLAFVCAQYNISGEFVRGVETAADHYGVKVVAIPASRSSINSAIAKFAAEPHGGMVVMPDFVTAILRDGIIAAAMQYRLPAIYGHRFFATDYGLMSYGTDIAESFSQAALYIDRILKGEKPADLPLQLPARYDLVINLRAARAIGLTVPETLLARADEVIE
jgi:putative tryptophan/tyrosine transport system substrate-binding protein